MEQESRELFSLQIEPITKSYLWETARWAKFLSIIGFIFCILILLGGLFFSSFFSYFARENGTVGSAEVNPTGLGVSMAFFYLILAVAYFFPCLFLYRFASKMKTALSGNAQDQLNFSFQNLKSLFKYFGIITIIALAMYGLVLVLAVLGLAARG